jgi:hypothetical protein
MFQQAAEPGLAANARDGRNVVIRLRMVERLVVEPLMRAMFQILLIVTMPIKPSHS